MVIRKQKKGVPISPLRMFSNPKFIGGLIKTLLPVAKAIAKEIIEEQSQPKRKPVKKKIQRKVTKKARPKKKSKQKIDYRHNLCRCGNVKMKTSKRCRVCEDKKRRR